MLNRLETELGRKTFQFVAKHLQKYDAPAWRLLEHLVLSVDTMPADKRLTHAGLCVSAPGDAHSRIYLNESAEGLIPTLCHEFAHSLQVLLIADKQFVYPSVLRRGASPDLPAELLHQYSIEAAADAQCCLWGLQEPLNRANNCRRHNPVTATVPTLEERQILMQCREDLESVLELAPLEPSETI